MSTDTRIQAQIHGHGHALAERAVAEVDFVLIKGRRWWQRVTPPQCGRLSDSVTWDSAGASCSADGAVLASIHNDAQNALYSALCSSGAVQGQCWAGATDQAVEGVWVFISDAPSVS